MILPDYEAYTSSGRKLIDAESYGECITGADCLIGAVCTSPPFPCPGVYSAYFITAEHIYSEGAGRRGVRSESVGDYSVTYSDSCGCGHIPPAAYALLVRAGCICRIAGDTP